MTVPTERESFQTGRRAQCLELEKCDFVLVVHRPARRKFRSGCGSPEQHGESSRKTRQLTLHHLPISRTSGLFATFSSLSTLRSRSRTRVWSLFMESWVICQGVGALSRSMVVDRSWSLAYSSYVGCRSI